MYFFHKPSTNTTLNATPNHSTTMEYHKQIIRVRYLFSFSKL